MKFQTLTFFLFLAIVFASHWGVRGRTLRNLILLLASYGFYAWWDWRFCGLMAASTVVDYVCGRMIHGTDVRWRRRAWLMVSLGANLGMLGFFKYFNFFAESFVAAADSIGWAVSPVTVQVVLPVGISFYTFQTLSYTIDIARGRLEPTRDFLAFGVFVAFFPQLVAGPIERASSLLPQFTRERVFDLDRAKEGMRLILWGLAQKMIIADGLAVYVDTVFRAPENATAPQMTLATVSFAFQVYCDFAAYSLISMGTARLFGVSLMQNFAYPFFARDMSELWKRWHISMTTWFRDYVYIPLGGSRNGRYRTWFNVVLAFTISGLWHGADWNRVLWGTINGVLIVLSTGYFTRKDRPEHASLRELPSILLTFTLFCLTLAIFRAQGMAEAGVVLSTIFDAGSWARDLGSVFAPAHERAAWIHVVLLVLIEWKSRDRLFPMENPRRGRLVRWLVYTVLIWDILLFAPVRNEAFFYFQF